MEFGYTGKILRINLLNGEILTENPTETFYRTYLGGEGVIAYFLLKELEARIDPYDAKNKLIFATGPVTGVPLAGTGRICIGSKSPLTGGFGASEVGGYLGPELKKAGFDVIIIEGKAKNPVYLSINNGNAKLMDASHIWGKTTGEVQEILKKELENKFIHIAQIGPAGENLVRFSCVISDLRNAAGRGGMGAIMGSKNLKAIVVNGQEKIKIKNPEKIKELRSIFNKYFLKPYKGYFAHGTGGGLIENFVKMGNIPVRNFRESDFDDAKNLDPQIFGEEIGLKMETCFACPVQCKKVVELKEPWKVESKFGGPEYETIAAFGTNCGINDFKVILKANELCNKYALDTISTGVTISFAMECFEKGIFNTNDTEGLKLNFGNGDALIKIISQIAYREGFGDLLAKGVKRVSKEIKSNSDQFSMHVKGLEIPMHEPRFKQVLGLGYATNPIGADHMHNLHDTSLANEQAIRELQPLGILEPLPLNDLSAQKVRALIYNIFWKTIGNSSLMCYFMPWTPFQQTEILRATTGWNITTWELMKIGERIINLTKIFNLREGFNKTHDKLPDRFHVPTKNGALAGIKINKNEFENARDNYYRMMGWDSEGRPKKVKLSELNIEWAFQRVN